MKRGLAALAVLWALSLPIIVSAAQGKLISVIFSGAATDTTAVGMADSSSIIGTGNYDRLYLHLKPNKPCKVAIQIRQHGITDSSIVSLPDSAQTAVWPWRMYNTAGAGGATDSLSLTQTVLPTAVQSGADELTVYFPQVGVSKWKAGRGLYIPLVGVDGHWYWGRQTSIRLRVLTAYGANEVVTWVATLEGVNTGK